MNNFALNLKTLRSEAGYSQQKLAELLGVRRSAIANYESGIREPSLDTLIAICKIFEVSTDFILGLSDK